MKTVRIQLYTVYERVWHWSQAIAILLLILTGLVIHSPDTFGFISMESAVAVHNVLGFLLVLNAFLGFFFFLTTGIIRQHLPQPRDFVSLAMRQGMYYLRGIFKGEAHPLEKTADQRLNPLQQVTYLLVLNVALPLQIVSGLLIWGAKRWPEAAEMVGGLPVLSLVHSLGAWLFGAFVVMHIYLTTTGHTPLSNMKAMIVGYEDLPADAHAAHHPRSGGEQVGAGAEEAQPVGEGQQA